MTDPLFDMTGRVVLVAGAARGLGLELARALAERGALIMVADRLGEEAREAARSLAGDGHEACELDIGSESSVDSAVAGCKRRFGRIDGLVNSVGIARFAPALDLSAEDFAETMTVNVTGAFLLSRSVARVMTMQSDGGRMLHLASVSSRVVNETYAAYSASKAALAQLVRILAAEWARCGITVNAIGPAVIRTAMTETTILADPATADRALEKIPMGRFGVPSDLIGAALLALAPGGGFITGQTIYVDGGRTLG